MPSTILLYEDDANVRQLVREVLVDSGYGVLDAHSFEHGKQAAECRMADLFLVDSDERGAARALERLRELCGDIGDKIPVVLFTAHRVVREEVQEAGCADVVTKPFDIDDLLRQVEENLRQPAGQ